MDSIFDNDERRFFKIIASITVILVGTLNYLMQRKAYMTIADILEIIEEKIMNLEIGMAKANEDYDYRYLEGQLFMLEIIKEHLENIEE